METNQPRYVHGHKRLEGVAFNNQKSKMKKIIKSRVPILLSRGTGVASKRVTCAAALLTLLLLSSTPLRAAQAQDARRGKPASTSTTSAVPAADTDLLAPGTVDARAGTIATYRPTDIGCAGSQ